MKRGSQPDKTVDSLNDAMNAETKDPTDDYVCLRDSQDGSMYYGEAGYLKK